MRKWWAEIQIFCNDHFEHSSLTTPVLDQGQLLTRQHFSTLSSEASIFCLVLSCPPQQVQGSILWFGKT